MKIAVAYENGEVFQHFGQTETFKIYNVEDGNITSGAIFPTNDAKHGALAHLLQSEGVSALICGGIGAGARTALTEAKIDVYPGAKGDADAQVAALIAGNLQYDPNTKCSHHEHEHGHHGHEHHGEGHSCHGGGSCHTK